MGVAAWRLGAGRARKEDPVSAAAGIICLAKPGEAVEAGQPVLELRADDRASSTARSRRSTGAVEIGSQAPEPAGLVLEQIG